MWVAAANRDRVGSAEGAVAAIVSGMVAHVGDEYVQREGLVALARLCIGNGTSVSRCMAVGAGRCVGIWW